REQFKIWLPYIASPRQPVAAIVKDADDYNVIITAGQGDDVKVFKAHM
ncbi:24962_t:CDS:2, partial [Gigaspora margarita]